MNPKELEATKKLLDKIMNDRIVVGCVTCNTFFLNLKWKEYIPLLHGDYRTPTKWYCKVVQHYCQNPEHNILSNRNPQGLNHQFSFTQVFKNQIADNGITIHELLQVANEMQEKLKDAPI